MAGAVTLDEPLRLEAHVDDDGRTVVLRASAWVLDGGDTSELDARLHTLVDTTARAVTDRLHEHRSAIFHRHASWA